VAFHVVNHAQEAQAGRLNSEGITEKLRHPKIIVNHNLELLERKRFIEIPASFCLSRDTPQHPPPTPARDRGGCPQWPVQRGVDGWDARTGARYEGTQPLHEGGHLSGTPHGQGVGLRASAPGRVWTGGVLQAVSALRRAARMVQLSEESIVAGCNEVLEGLH
jgi:hypothetical protein